MSIEEPARGAGRKEPISLDSHHLLEECRMVFPGLWFVLPIRERHRHT